MNDRRRPSSIRRWCLPWVLGVILGFARPASAGPVTDWFDDDLMPWLTEQLVTHPRFRGEPIRVAAFDGEQEDAMPDELSANLVSRLQGRLAEGSRVRLAWRPPAPDWNLPAPPLKAFCRPAEEAYVVAIEARRIRDSAATVRVRVLDVSERQWVPGLLREWQGRPGTDELSRLGEARRRDDLAGHRELPFESGQEDLLAARAAETLGCALMAHPAEDLRLWYDPEEETGANRKVARLVPQYLARAGVLRVASDRAEANLVMAMESQVLDPVTRQLWIALEPASPDPDLPSVRTSVYVRPDTPVPSPGDERAGTAVAVDSSREIRAVMLSDECEGAGCGSDRETRLLQVSAPGFRHVEILALTGQGALFRLDPAGCSRASRRAPADSVQVRLKTDQRDLMTIFVVAGRTAKAAETLAGELSSIPEACGATGLRGAALRGRLVTVQRRLAVYGNDIRWRRIAVAEPISRMHLAGATER